MIQRIQTIYLAIASALMSSFLIWPIDYVSNEVTKAAVELRWDAIYDVSTMAEGEAIQSANAVAILIIGSMILNIVSIFLYKNRPTQGRMAGIAFGLEIGLSAVLVYLGIEMASTIETEWHFSIRWITPIVAAILDILAYRRISDDEALIRSLDRLR